MSDRDQDQQQRHVLTPAAVSDDVKPPREPRASEQQLLLALAITASLPRVLWGLTVDATRWFGESYGEMQGLFALLRYGGLLVDVLCLVLIGMLAPLDKIVPGTNGKRIAAIALGAIELCLTFLPLGAFLYRLPFGYFATTLPSLIASMAFALWLGALLRPSGRAPMLVWILVSATVIQVLANTLFAPVPLLGTIVGVLVLVEVMRVRRAIEDAR